MQETFAKAIGLPFKRKTSRVSHLTRQTRGGFFNKQVIIEN